VSAHKPLEWDETADLIASRDLFWSGVAMRVIGGRVFTGPVKFLVPLSPAVSSSITSSLPVAMLSSYCTSSPLISKRGKGIPELGKGPV
jgi:hypothetical protein